MDGLGVEGDVVRKGSGDDEKEEGIEEGKEEEEVGRVGRKEGIEGRTVEVTVFKEQNNEGEEEYISDSSSLLKCSIAFLKL